jgi:hypothetical protein
VEIGFSDGNKEISSKGGSWKFRQNGVCGNFIEMGFSEGPHQESRGNFVEIRFSGNLHWGSCGNFVEMGFSTASRKFRRNGVRGNFVKMGFVEISSKWGSLKFRRNGVFRRPPSRISWKFRRN